MFVIASALTSKIALPLWSEEPIRIGCFLLIIGVSLLSWRYFEKPMNKLGVALTAPFLQPSRAI